MAGRPGRAHLLPLPPAPATAPPRRWVAASPPLHADIDTHKTGGLGPAMPFAHRLLLSSPSSANPAPSFVSGPGGEDPDPLVLGLVPCAVCGTRIWMWARGQPLYPAAVADSSGSLGAVLWFQGESDAIEVDDAWAYGGKMERLVADLREDLGLPNLLVIQVGLASGEGNYTNIIREAQRNINLPNVILVDDQLPLHGGSTPARRNVGASLSRIRVIQRSL